MNHTQIRQANVGVQGHGGRLRLSQCDIHSCQHGLRLSAGLQHYYSSPKDVKEADMNFYFLNVHNNEYGMSLYGKNDEFSFILGYSKIENNDRNGIQVTNWDASREVTKTRLFILYGSVNYNKVYGVELSEGLRFDLFVHNSSFRGNENHGIRIYQWYPDVEDNTVVISESTFIDNRNNAFEFYCRYCDFRQISFLSNNFSGHSQEALDVYITSRTSEYNTTLAFKNNQFSSNLRDIKVDAQSDVRTVIENNRFFQSRYALTVSSNDLDKNRVLIFGNEFVNTGASSSTDVLVDINGVTSDIKNNTFLNCSVPSLIFLRTGFDHSVGLNKFQNSSASSCFVKLDQNYSPNDSITLDGNYWGTREKEVIKQKICDFFYNSKKAIASVSSYYPTDQMETLTSSPELDSFRYERNTQQNAYIVGGIVNQDLDLSNLGSENIIVNRSILISEGVSVILGQAVVNFTSARGIVVLGKQTSSLNSFIYKKGCCFFGKVYLYDKFTWKLTEELKT